MKNFRDLLSESYGISSDILKEEIHPQIAGVLNYNSATARNKLNVISKKIRDISKNGESHGFESGSPKKGSSRAVFFPEEGHHAIVDGHHVEIPSALKIAYHGWADKKLSSQGHQGPLLGEMQNEQETDHYLQHRYGMLRQGERTNEFHTNHEGILPPVLDSHEDNHWALHSRIRPVGAGEFRELTKTPEFPRGISHKEFFAATNAYHSLSHGRDPISHGYSDEHLEKLADHPLVAKATDFIGESGAHPADFVKGNMGIWEHPVTKTRHIVIADHGFNNDIAKLYDKARRS